MLVIREITSKRDKLKFYKFPINLYKNNAYFVPTLIVDEKIEFNANQNGAFAYSECRMWLAERDGVIVGRIAGILNNAYNDKTGEKQMRFSRFDFIDDYEVSQELFAAVKDYAKEVGMTELIGPIGFSDLDKQGLLVEGFDKLDMYLTCYNHEYYITHFELLGLTKKVDWVEFFINLPQEIDPRLERIANHAIERYGYKVLHFKKMKEAKFYLLGVLKVLNLSFDRLFGVVWLSDKQFLDFAEMILAVGNPDLLSVVQNKEGEVIGYGFLAPSISKAVQKSKGKLLPFGALRILRELKTCKHLDFYHMGVMPEYQNKGVNAIIMLECLKGAIKNKTLTAETGPELELNVEVQSQWKKYDAHQHKRRRCYTLPLGD